MHIIGYTSNNGLKDGNKIFYNKKTLEIYQKKV